MSAQSVPCPTCNNFVFPQDGTTPDILGHYPREGGLTKRELFAAMIYAADTVGRTARECVREADELLEALNESPR